MKRVTMQNLANELGVSRNTVLNALSGKKGVSEGVREQILEKANEMGYIYKSKSAPRPKSVVVVCRKEYWLDQTYFAEIFLGITEIAMENNISVDFVIANEIEMSANQQKLNKCQGIIIAGKIENHHIDELVAYGRPIIFVDFEPIGYRGDSVVMNNDSGVYQAIEALVSRGHKEIGFIGNSSMLTSFRARYVSYRFYMKHFGLDIKEEYVLKNADKPYWDEATLSKALDSLDKFPSAFFCANDRTAFTLYKELQKRNISIPDDISVIGFDDVMGCGMVSPTLSTVSVYKTVLGREAMNLFLSRYDNPRLMYRKMLIDTEVIIRESVKRQEILEK